MTSKSPSSTSTPGLISSTSELSEFLSSIPASSILYLDLEGYRLGRKGNISIITIYLHPDRVARLIDVLALGKSAFDTQSSDGKTLKSILEDPRVPKCFWDVRNDANALWHLYKVGLAGIIDIQLLETASRTEKYKGYLRGLHESIYSELMLGPAEGAILAETKHDVASVMRDDLGPGEDLFSIRPMGVKTIRYCVNNVIYLPELHALYLRRIEGAWYDRAIEEIKRRVDETRSLWYNSDLMKHAPWTA